MNPTMAPAQHLHLDIELDRKHRFHYRSQGRDGRRMVLHRGDTITFTCEDDFSIRFVKKSPLESARLQSHEETILQSHESYLTASVRDDAPYGESSYVLKVKHGGGLFEDSGTIAIEEAGS